MTTVTPLPSPRDVDPQRRNVVINNLFVTTLNRPAVNIATTTQWCQVLSSLNSQTSTTVLHGSSPERLQTKICRNNLKATHHALHLLLSNGLWRSRHIKRMCMTLRGIELLKFALSWVELYETFACTSQRHCNASQQCPNKSTIVPPCRLHVCACMPNTK